MSFALERKLIETCFKAGMPADAPIQYGNTAFQPPATGFYRMSIIGGGKSGLMALTGGSQRRHAGRVIDVSIFVPKDGGTAVLRERADFVEAALAHQSLSEGACRIVIGGATLQEIGPAGDWYQGNVTVTFTRDIA